MLRRVSGKILVRMEFLPAERGGGRDPREILCYGEVCNKMLTLKDKSALVFITSHLLPNANNFDKRCSQYENGKVCAFDDEVDVGTGTSVIWLGDFNWRVDQLSAQEMVKYVFTFSFLLFVSQRSEVWK